MTYTTRLRLTVSELVKDKAEIAASVTFVGPIPLTKPLTAWKIKMNT